MARDKTGGIIGLLMRLQRVPLLGRAARELLVLWSAVDIPPMVRFGRNTRLVHRGLGTVIHPYTQIGANVQIYPHVTIGRRNVEVPDEEDDFAGVIVEDDVILGAGACVLGGSEPLVVARGTIVGANAVLLQSTGENEVWAGVPARCVSKRANAKF